MANPLMPKATAVWLVENSSLTFEQIADFCDLHALEVQGIADDEVAIGIQGLDPIVRNQLTREEIDRCAEDPSARLKLAEQDLPKPLKRTKGPRYTPVAKRQDKPDGVAWLARHHPELKDSQIARLIGTTKNTIVAVRERTHWNMSNIKAQDPVRLDLCSRHELDTALERVGYMSTTQAALEQSAAADSEAEAESGTVVEAGAGAEEGQPAGEP